MALTARLTAWLAARWQALREEREGQALVEYALILALVAIAAIAALHFLGGAAGNSLNSVSQNLTNATP
jgi:pilus assembly protein Flp/PilA